MHFHLPKPLHGWREFAGEVGIIVLGVLIALGAESIIDDARWNRQVRATQVALNDELAGIGLQSYERVILQPCLMGRLSTLGTALRNTKGHWKGSPMTVYRSSSSRALLSAYRPVNRPLVVDAWQNAEASGTLNHMARNNVLQMAGTYSQARQFYEFQEEEARSAARVMPLAYDTDLSADMRLNMMAAVGDLDRINAIMALMARQMLDNIASMHLAFDRADIEASRKEIVAQDREFYGTCVAETPLRV